MEVWCGPHLNSSVYLIQKSQQIHRIALRVAAIFIMAPSLPLQNFHYCGLEREHLSVHFWRDKQCGADATSDHSKHLHNKELHALANLLWGLLSPSTPLRNKCESSGHQFVSCDHDLCFDWPHPLYVSKGP
ncbi:interleukin-15 receptor subunit alpha isoform X3 [Leuresthes tenuis]|uniref:interleukin-15 receptor subunit alpha isoform X3 n=1 Tax=Leuresthes tenuis TaxID=355514 RepID=UPI003B502CD2